MKSKVFYKEEEPLSLLSPDPVTRDYHAKDEESTFICNKELRYFFRLPRNLPEFEVKLFYTDPKDPNALLIERVAKDEHTQTAEESAQGPEFEVKMFYTDPKNTQRNMTRLNGKVKNVSIHPTLGRWFGPRKRLWAMVYY